jgi:hypothetical protein
MNGGTVRRLGLGAVVAIAVLAMAGLRLVGEGRAGLAASDAAFSQGDVMAAVIHARDAARAYVPFAAHTEQGFLKLRDIALKTERRGDTEAALFAWRALLSAAAGTRPFSGVTDQARADAEASVARLSAELRALAQGGRGVPQEADARSALRAADVVPRIGWGALLLTGACLWWGAGVRLTSRGWGTDDRLAPREVRVAGGMAFAGLIAWLLGLFFC